MPETLILMRGLPSCGKSHTARELAGPRGCLIEVDQFWFGEVGNNPRVYTWRASEVSRERDWTYQQVSAAVHSRQSPIVVDGMNDVDRHTARYVTLAVEAGYRVEIHEPRSPWWGAIRPLLEDPGQHRAQLDRWAHKLAVLNRSTHGVPYEHFCERIRDWRHDVTVDDYLVAAR